MSCGPLRPDTLFYGVPKQVSPAGRTQERKAASGQLSGFHRPQASPVVTLTLRWRVFVLISAVLPATCKGVFLSAGLGPEVQVAAVEEKAAQDKLLMTTAIEESL
jgi:hypothetical protein